MSAQPVLHACSGSACRICTPESGPQRRDKGMEAAQYGGVGTERQEWLDRFVTWLPAYLRHVGGEATSDDIRRALEAKGNTPPSDKLWGIGYRLAASRGVVVRVGYVESTLPSRNSGIASVYRATS